ncbi:MAG: PQQ-binding-like beta-propeller repeat protein, partial [Verrucomicrobia bacterium]|nr:PQQ-binding-like beta-propeller repeat protein [Verrucomicrobiota bacterium]
MIRLRNAWSWILGVALSHVAATGANWPQFRGPASNGVADDSGLPVTWSTNQNIDWSVPIPGAGWSSPIVWGDRIFLTTVISDGPTEPPKKGLYFGGERPTTSTNLHHWVVLCIDLDTGRTVWQKEVHCGAPSVPHHLKNTYASETPVTDGERVYAYFGNVGLFCLDFHGRELWSQHWGAFRTRNGWGTAASPVLDQDRIYVINDNEEQSFLVALDKRRGTQLWRVDRDEQSNWATAFLWRNQQRTELVTPGRNRVRSYDREGHLLWELGGMSSIVIPTPFAQDGLLYVASGYVGDRVRPVFAVRPGARGDISLKENRTTNQFIAWHQPTGGPYNPSPIVYDGLFYVLYDFGFLSCSDART